MMDDNIPSEKLRKDIYTAKLTAYMTQSTNPVKQERIEELRIMMDKAQEIVDEILDE